MIPLKLELSIFFQLLLRLLDVPFSNLQNTSYVNKVGKCVYKQKVLSWTCKSALYFTEAIYNDCATYENCLKCPLSVLRGEYSSHGFEFAQPYSAASWKHLWPIDEFHHSNITPADFFLFPHSNPDIQSHVTRILRDIPKRKKSLPAVLKKSSNVHCKQQRLLRRNIKRFSWFIYESFFYKRIHVTLLQYFVCKHSCP